MDEAIVKTEEQLYREWCNRPSAMAHFSFEGWKDRRSGATVAEVGRQQHPSLGLDPIRPRHVTSVMNKLETKYAAHLELRKTAGEIHEYRFEPMKLRLAPKTYFDIDFLVVQCYQGFGGDDVFDVELHEVKGHWEDDARVKMKVAAALFPWWKFRGVQWDRTTKNWKYEEFHA